MPGIVRASSLRSDALGRLPLTKRGGGDLAFRLAGSPALSNREAQMARVVEDAFSHIPARTILDVFATRDFGKFSQETLEALVPFASTFEKLILDQFNDSGSTSGDEIASQISNDYQRVGKAEEILPSAASMLFKFDRTSPTALAYAKASSGSMITNMVESQRTVFRSLVTQAYESGLTPQGLKSQVFTALQVVNPSSPVVGSFASTLGVSMNGLTTRYEQAVMTRANNLIARSIKQGMSAEKAVAKAQADAKKYADRLRRARAKTIARTELLKANNEGRLESFVQAQKKGLVGKDARKVWATSRFDVCNICAPLNGQMVPLKQPFPNGVMTPPAHPNCRCSITLLSNVKTHKPPTSLGTGKPGDPLLTTYGGPTDLATTLAETPLPDIPIGTSVISIPKPPTTTVQIPPAPSPAPPPPPTAPTPAPPSPPTPSASSQTINVANVEWKVGPLATEADTYVATNGTVTFKYDAKAQTWAKFKPSSATWEAADKVPMGSQLYEVEQKLIAQIPKPLPSAVAPKAPAPSSKLKLPTEPKKIGKKGEIIGHTINPDGSVWVKSYTYKGTEYGWMRQPDGSWKKGYKYKGSQFIPHSSTQFSYVNGKVKVPDLKLLEEHLASKGFPVSGGIPTASPPPPPMVSAPTSVAPTPTTTPSAPSAPGALKPVQVAEPTPIAPDTTQGFDKFGINRANLVEDHASASKLGGQNPKRVFTDPSSGQQYIFKPQPKWQALLEETASETAERLGIAGPKVAVVEIDGQVGSLHRVLSEGGKVDNVKPIFKGQFQASKLSEKQAESLQINQIFDHLLSNHDAHADQFIRLPSVQDSLLRPIGIDKGQAFKHLGKAGEQNSLLNGFPGAKLFNPNNNAVSKQPYINLWEQFFSGSDVKVVAPSQSTEIQTLLKRVKQLVDNPNDPLWTKWAQVSSEMGQAGKASSPTAVIDAIKDRFAKLENQVAEMEKKILESPMGRQKFLSHLPDPNAQAKVDAILSDINAHQAVGGVFETKSKAWWTSESAPQINSLSQMERRAVTSYTGSSYTSINRALESAARNQQGLSYLDDTVRKTVEKIDKAMAKTSLSEDVKVWRGASGLKVQGGRTVTDASQASSLVGQIIEQEGFTSTSVTDMGGFGGTFKFEFKVPKGTRGMYVAPISRFSSENEFLLDRGLRYLVTNVRKTGSQTIIEATVIPEGVGTSIVPTSFKPM